jgi:hypothetical protein
MPLLKRIFQLQGVPGCSTQALTLLQPIRYLARAWLRGL